MSPRLPGYLEFMTTRKERECYHCTDVISKGDNYIAQVIKRREQESFFRIVVHETCFIEHAKMYFQGRRDQLAEEAGGRTGGKPRAADYSDEQQLFRRRRLQEISKWRGRLKQRGPEYEAHYMLKILDSVEAMQKAGVLHRAIESIFRPALLGAIEDGARVICERSNDVTELINELRIYYTDRPVAERGK